MKYFEIQNIKATIVDEFYKFDILGLPFGGLHKGKDLHGQFFTENTDFQMNIGDEIPTVHMHGFGQQAPEFFEKAKLASFDKNGGWFEVFVEKKNPLGKKFYNAANKGKLRASTGRAGSLGRFKENGEATLWVPGELSIFEKTPQMKPINELAIGMNSLKSMYNDNHINWSETLEKGRLDENKLINEDIEMNKEEMKALLEEFVKGMKSFPTTDEVEKFIEEALTKAKIGEEDETGLKAQEIKDLFNEEFEKAFVTHLRNLDPGQSPPAFNVKNTKANKAFWGDESVNEPVAAFNDWFKTGKKNDDLTDYEPGGEKAAWQEGTDSEGGYTVLDTVEAKIMEYRDEVSLPRMMGAQVLQVSGKLHDVPLENTRLTDWAITAEEGAWDEDEGDLGVAAITTYKQTKLQKTSVELLQDTEADLLAFYVSRWGRSAGITDNLYFFVGTGSGQPQGIFVGGTKAGDLASATTITAGEVLETYFALPQPYRKDAVWAGGAAINAIIRGLTGDPFLFMATPQGQIDPDSLMGKKFFESIKVPAIADAAKCIAFCSVPHYIITERQGMTISRNDSLFENTGQVGHFVSRRQGGAVGIAEAFQYQQALDV